MLVNQHIPSSPDFLFFFLFFLFLFVFVLKSARERERLLAQESALKRKSTLLFFALNII